MRNGISEAFVLNNVSPTKRSVILGHIDRRRPKFPGKCRILNPISLCKISSGSVQDCRSYSHKKDFGRSQ